VDKDVKYRFQIVNKGVDEVYTGEQLVDGIPVELSAGDVNNIIVFAQRIEQ
jgi:hypothetical protein